MAADNKPAVAGTTSSSESGYLEKFRLYESHMKFYIVGTCKNKSQWRVLVIDRLEPSELNIHEDPTTYSAIECKGFLNRVHKRNIANGGLKFVTKCYGIAGVVKFLGPYYMLLITRRRKIGNICGHSIYGVSESEMIVIPNSTVLSTMPYSKDENRYKQLLSSVDLRKDFFFSYSYNITQSLQNNFQEGETAVLYKSMFIWNEFLTQSIRNHLRNTVWTVALVHGFFKQAKLSAHGKNFRFTLIARRSRHFAGTRYLKRGVNKKGRVANDVEIEQIVCVDTHEEIPPEITSVVQNRGSIPLFWSQEPSKLNIRPDIILHKDMNFDATRLHFDNLVKRYGNPIIILNLIKSCEKKPRESLLRTEFGNAINSINKDLPEEKCLKFLHWDIGKHYRRKGENLLDLLGKVAVCALDLTSIFHCQLRPPSRIRDAVGLPDLGRVDSTKVACKSQGRVLSVSTNSSYGSSWNVERENFDVFQSDCLGDRPKHNNDNSANEIQRSRISHYNYHADEAEFTAILVKPSRVQSGVLRTNCIDCLDRTNVAQYAYGLVALVHQLHALGLIDSPKVDSDSPLVDCMMDFYEIMGDTLSLQYGGSAAHNKIFWERRGQWKATIQSQDLLRSIQRYYNNVYTDAKKQDAIHLFLGRFQPQKGKPALWEIDPDQHYSCRRQNALSHENTRSFIERSLSDDNILCGCQCRCELPISYGAEPDTPVGEALPLITEQEIVVKCRYDSMPETLTCNNNIQYSSHRPTISEREISSDSAHVCFGKLRFDNSNYSNFLDFDLLSSLGISCDDEGSDRSTINSSTMNLSAENLTDGDDISRLNIEVLDSEDPEAKGRQASESSKTGEFSEFFARWVAHGSTLFS